MKESETRAMVVFSGLPAPEVNVPLVIAGERIGIVDLLIRCVMLVLEYEGRQHAESIIQFNRDIDRYAAFRRHRVEYLQVTNEMLDRPKTLIHRVHARMVERATTARRRCSPIGGTRCSTLIPSSGASVAQPRAGWATKSPSRLAMGD